MPRAKKQRLKRRSDGRYCAEYKGKLFYGASEEEALEKRNRYKEDEKAGRLPSQCNLFIDYASRWLSAYKKHLTKAPYNQHVRIINHFVSVVGNKPIRTITPTDISLFYQTYNGYSASYLRDVRSTINGIMSSAFQDRIIDRNPVEKIKLPKGTKGTHRAITPEERLIIHQLQHRMRPAVMVMLYAGLRRGEAAALNIERDVDFQAKTITVREAVRFSEREEDHALITAPKTEAGYRVIPLMDILAEELKGLTGNICTTAKGQPITEMAWVRGWNSYIAEYEKILNFFPSGKRWWGRTKEHRDIIKNGGTIPPWKSANLRCHDLRHSYCTMLYDLGVDIKTAMLWMGHSDETMIMRIYAHLTEQRQEAAKKALENPEKILFPRQNSRQNDDEAPEPLKTQDHSN